MEFREIKSIISSATGAGTRFLAIHIPKLDYVTKAHAYRLYGRGVVERWLTEKLLTLKGKYIDRHELEMVSKRCNRLTYLPVKQRRLTNTINEKD